MHVFVQKPQFTIQTFVQLIKVFVFDPLSFLCGWCRWQCLKTVIKKKTKKKRYLDSQSLMKFHWGQSVDVAGILTSAPKRINNVQKQGDSASSKVFGCSYLPLCVSLWMYWDHQRGDGSPPGCSSVPQDHLSLPGRSRSITHENRHAGSF